MSSPEILPQQRRENPDPQERTTPIPWLVLALAIILAAFGVDYISHAKLFFFQAEDGIRDTLG